MRLPEEGTSQVVEVGPALNVNISSKAYNIYIRECTNGLFEVS